MATDSREHFLLSLVLPPAALQWFDVTEAEEVGDEIHITLVEKNTPPPTTGDTPLCFKGYKDMVMSDFPIRGKHVALRIRRRYWKEADSDRLVTNTIPLVFPGTKLAEAFAHFLKDAGGNASDLLGEYRDFESSFTKGV